MVCRAAVSPGPVTTCHATVTANAKCRFMNTTCGGHPGSRRGGGGRQQVSHGGCEPSRDGLRERRVSFHEPDKWRLTTEPQGRGRPSPGVTPRLRAVTRRSQGTPNVVSRARQLAPTAMLARPGSAQANEYPPPSCLSTHGAPVIELNRWNDCRSAYPALCRPFCLIVAGDRLGRPQDRGRHPIAAGPGPAGSGGYSSSGTGGMNGSSAPGLGVRSISPAPLPGSSPSPTSASE